MKRTLSKNYCVYFFEVSLFSPHLDGFMDFLQAQNESFSFPTAPRATSWFAAARLCLLNQEVLWKTVASRSNILRY